MTGAMRTRFDNPVLTIIGDRQTGKTHTALSLAVTQAYQGDDVLYTCHGGDQARHNLEEAVGFVERLDLQVTRVSRVNGQPGISFPSGGKVSFRPVSRSSRGDRKYDLHILDDDAQEQLCSDRIIRVITTSF